MSKNNIEVELHYGNKNFDELMKKLIFRKINQSDRARENKNTKDNQTTIHHKDIRR
jgi:hypothetical protein